MESFEIATTQLPEESVSHEHPSTEIFDVAMRNRIASWARDLFEGLYNRATSLQSHFASDREVEVRIALLTNSSNAYEQGLYTPDYREGVKIFLDELIQFTREKSTNEDERDQLQKFVAHIHETLFSFSPSLANQIGTDNLFIVTAQANHVPEVQGWLGQNMVGELTYELSYGSDETVEAILNKTNSLSLPALLDVIHQCQTVGADAIAQGEWAESGLNRIRKIVHAIRDQNASPLVHYAVDAALKRLTQEEANPSLSVITYHGNKHAGRLTERLSTEWAEQHQALTHQINPDRAIEPGAKLIRVSQDAIGILDHSNILRAVGSITTELPPAQETSLVSLRNAQNALENGRYYIQPHELQEVVHAIQTATATPPSGTASTLLQELNASKRYMTPQRYTEMQTELQELATRESRDSSTPEHETRDIVAYLRELETSQYTLFAPVHIESIEETVNAEAASKRIPELALLIQHVHSPSLREHIENDLGISFTDMSLRSQINFLPHLASKDQAGFSRLRNTIQQYKGDKTQLLNSFLAVGFGEEYGAKIEELAQKSLDAPSVFQKFNDVASLATTTNEELRKQFFKHDTAIDPTEEIMKRAQKLLDTYAQAFLDLESSPQDSDKKEEMREHLLAELEAVRRDVVLFASMFKTAFKGRDHADFSEVQGLDFEVMSGHTPLSAQQEMLAIAKENYRSNHVQQQNVLNQLRQAFENSNNRFYLLKKDNLILAFMRFEERDNNTLYAGSFNVRPEYRGSAIGEAMLHNALDDEAKNHSIEAIAETSKDVSNYYLEHVGFVATGTTVNERTHIPYFTLLRNDRLNKRYISKAMPDREILEAYHQRFSKLPAAELRKEKFFIVRLPEHITDRERHAFFSTMLSGGDYSITRAIRDGSTHCYVFERAVDTADAESEPLPEAA